MARKAWDVYWAGRLHTSSANDLLLAQLGSAKVYREANFSSAEYTFVLTLFDGLIESGIAVPADALESFEERWRDEVLILLARTRGNEDLLLQMRDKQLNQAQWLAVNNLLLRTGSARFFATTLAELRIRHRYLVVDPGTGGGFGCGLVSDRQSACPWPCRATQCNGDGGTVVVCYWYTRLQSR